jgi:hypothetical protein
MSRINYAYTDYPFVELGDKPAKLAPIRKVTPLYYDKDRYAVVDFEGEKLYLKACYLYVAAQRMTGTHLPTRVKVKHLPDIPEDVYAYLATKNAVVSTKQTWNMLNEKNHDRTRCMHTECG